MLVRAVSKSLLIGFVCLSTYCAAGPAMSQTHPEANACLALTINDCRDLIDDNKIVGAEAGTILRNAAETHLAQRNPDEAILFLTVAESRDPDSALTQKLWGDAYVMRAEKASQNTGELAQLGTQIEYIQATGKYAAGLGIDPGSQANFSGVVLAVTRSGHCGLAENVQQEFGGRFQQTADQETLADFIKEKCGG